MRKFTLYQASRHTGISRYKLEQAIDSGHLKIFEGKGNVKCYIHESDLTQFIEKHADQYRRFSYPNEQKQPFVSDVIHQYIDNYEKLIQEKDRVISLLEFQNQKLMPLTEKNESSTIKIHELREIASKAINHLPNDKPNLISDLKQQLDRI
jgi:hypothetical protein